MTIEVIDIRITDRENGTVTMIARDVSEENLMRFERYRDDGFEKELEYQWNTRESRQFLALRKWLKSQRVTQDGSNSHLFYYVCDLHTGAWTKLVEYDLGYNLNPLL